MAFENKRHHGSNTLARLNDALDRESRERTREPERKRRVVPQREPIQSAEDWLAARARWIAAAKGEGEA